MVLARLSLALLLFSVVACGDEGRDAVFKVETAIVPMDLPESHVDAELKPYVDAFREDARRFGRDYDEPDRLRVEYAGAIDGKVEDKSEVGLCSKRSYERQMSGVVRRVHSVRILRSISDDRYAVERTVYHELGHCLLGLEHEDALSAKSIMAKDFVLGTSLADDKWEALVSELFATY